MKKLILLTLIFSTYLLAQTPFILTGIKKVYPMVEINTKVVPQSYKEDFFNKLIKTTKRLNIDTTGYSHRPLVIQITTSNVADTTVYKTVLIMGEEMKRLDDGEEVFAITYQMSDEIETDDLKEELYESVDFLLEQFADQYVEDNE